MTVEDVRARVEEIRAKAEEGDDEVAHSREDDLYRDVFQAIIATCQPESYPWAMARAALKTNEIEFARWCA